MGIYSPRYSLEPTYIPVGTNMLEMIQEVQNHTYNVLTRFWHAELYSLMQSWFTFISSCFCLVSFR